MLKRSLMLCGLTAMALFLSSCLLDPDEDPPGDDPPPALELKPLTEKWHVLNNIEYAYSRRVKSAYEELLNEDFTFFFAPGDVGGEIPATWDRNEEFGATGRLFDSNGQPEPPADPVCRSIRLDLQYDPDQIQWVEKIPENFPAETWYYTTVFYTFTFEMLPSDTYIAQPGAKAEFAVRNAGTEQDPHWELVEFRDLGN
ncbi:MAG TPA: hypothetical protein VEC56_10975 [Candidatus Krumholzibacteria bacterium]|nr:hypothetical protein [Candidatus Krumholzibacteria bacterium]